MYVTIFSCNFYVLVIDDYCIGYRRTLHSIKLCTYTLSSSINPLTHLIAFYILNEETSKGIICYVISIILCWVKFHCYRAEEATESWGGHLATLNDFILAKIELLWSPLKFRGMPLVTPPMLS